MAASRTEAVMRTVEYVALFAYFGKAWVEPHAALADTLSIDARLSLPLVAIGGGVGLLATRLESRAGRAASEALLAIRQREARGERVSVVKPCDARQLGYGAFACRELAAGECGARWTCRRGRTARTATSGS